MIKQLTLVVVAVTMLMGCHRPEQKKEEKQMQTIRFNMYPKVMTLDPRVGGDTRSLIVTRMLFETLVRLDPSDNPTPALAQTIDLSDDGRVYTFTLRPSVWSNGDPVTAYDFEYSWKGTISPSSASNYGYILYPILNARAAKEGKVGIDEVGIVSLDAQTLQVTLEHPTPYFLHIAATPVLSPVHQEWEKSHPNWAGSPDAYVGNGPFVLKVWDRGTDLVLEKNPQYWDRDTVTLDRIQISSVDDPYTALLMYERGEFDYIGEPVSPIPLECLPQMRKAHTLQTKPIDTVFRFDFNTTQFPLNNPLLRKALAYALDRDLLVKSILKGDEKIVTSLLPPGLTLHQEPLFADSNIKEAQALFEQGLAECKLTAAEFPTIKLLYSTIAGQKAIAQAVQQQWQQTFGIEIELDGAEFATYYQSLVGGKFQIAAMNWHSYYHDPIYNLEIYKTKDSRFNASKWENADYLGYLDASDRDPVRRGEYLKAAEALISDEMPICPVFAASIRYTTRAEGVYVSPVGHVDFKWARVNRDR